MAVKISVKVFHFHQFIQHFGRSEARSGWHYIYLFRQELLCVFILVQIGHVRVFLRSPLRKLQVELPTVFRQAQQMSDHFSPDKRL